MMGSGWDLFQLAYRNSISPSLPLQDFFSGSSRVLYFFFFGGGGGECNLLQSAAICCNLNHGTRHNLITFGTEFKQIFVFSLHTVVLLYSVSKLYAPREHNEASDTFLKVLFPN